MRPHPVPLEERIRIGAELRAGRYSKRGERAVLARAFAVTVRDLWNWEHHTPGEAGRPRDPDALVAEAMEACRGVLEDLGYDTWWKTVWGALRERYSMYRVQQCTGILKDERAARERLVRLLARVSVHVSLGDVLWSLDETHLGRVDIGEAVLGIVVREVASTRTLVVSVGPAATAEDLIRVLEHLRAVRGELPLVIAMDNGPAMRSELVGMYLRFHEVVPLFNVPYVSQHNSWVETGHRRLKCAA